MISTSRNQNVSLGMEKKDGSVTSPPPRSRGHPSQGAVSHRSQLAVPRTGAMYPQRQPPVPGLSFSPASLPGRALHPWPRPAARRGVCAGACPRAVCLPWQQPRSWRSSESAFQGTTNFRRKFVARRRPGRISGEKCSCDEAVPTLLACQHCPRDPP